MSSAPDLIRSAEIMVEMGIISKEKAENVEHCVDDAVDLLSELTAIINDNISLKLAITAVVKSEARKELLDENVFEFIGKEQSLLSSHVLPNCADLIFEEAQGVVFVEVSVSSESLNIPKTVIACKTEDNNYYLSKNKSEFLNYSHDFGNGKK